MKRCVGCGWSVAEPPAPNGRAGIRRYAIWAAVLSLLLFAAVRYADRYMPQVADWYAGFAAQHLPSGLSRFAPAPTDPGALYYCARRVVKEMHDEGSVATFASHDQATATLLGDGRYEVRSFVDEARRDGEQVRHGFVCTLRHERGRWTLEDLAMENQTAGEALRTNALQSD